MQAAALGRLWRTAIHLRPGQVFRRVQHHLWHPRPETGPAPELAVPAAGWISAPAGAPGLLGSDGFRFRFLNAEHEFAGAADWNRTDRDKLWLYNLHYFADLVAADAPARADRHRVLIARWIAENPPGAGNGWEPYCLSLRIVNWLKWQCQGGGLDAAARHSLAVQVRLLRRSLEWHLRGNHLFENARALCFAGCCHRGPEADLWLAEGRRLLEDQLDEQVLADGGHFERSPMYHALVLEGVLDLLNLTRAAQAAGRGGLAALHVRLAADARRMLGWLQALTHPDGEIALFNDAAFGIAPAPAALQHYASALGVVPEAAAVPEALWLPASGYARLAVGPALLLADAGALGPDYQPGHGHADTLSFELSLHGRRVIVDAGTSRYGTGPERLAQRRTGAHNTVELDGRDSSEVWSGFRVGRRARVCAAGVLPDAAGPAFAAAHDGYRCLPGRPVHRRSWRLRTGGLEIVDRLDGGGEHDISAGLLLHPDCSARRLDDGRIDIGRDGRRCCVLAVTGADGLAPEPADYHPEFGKVLATTRLVARARRRLPAELHWRLDWIAAD